MQVIPTVYHQTTFRSRLEARWAVLMDGLGIRWEYEPEGFQLSDGTLYLPDFWLPQVHFWAEVKPNDEPDRLVIADDALAKARRLVLDSERPLLFLDGVPRFTNYWALLAEDGDTCWCDVDLFVADRYHLTEARFYMSTGCAKELDHTDFGGLLPWPAELEAIVRARSFKWAQQ